MDKGRVSKFFKAYANGQTYKVFLEDVSAIYRVNLKMTPPLAPYFESSKELTDPLEYNRE
jgi:hypothetical protein